MTTATKATASRRQATPRPGFDAQLAARDADMTIRLQAAGLRHGVNSRHAETTVALADVVRLIPADQSTTPVAALLQRAQQRILRGGWSRDTARNDQGGACLIAAIQTEARSHRDEGEARLFLRRALGGGDSIPEMNRRLRSAGHAAQILGQAARLAAVEGI
jgi:hypothetical protein